MEAIAHDVNFGPCSSIMVTETAISFGISSHTNGSWKLDINSRGNIHEIVPCNFIPGFLILAAAGVPVLVDAARPVIEDTSVLSEKC